MEKTEKITINTNVEVTTRDRIDEICTKNRMTIGAVLDVSVEEYWRNVMGIGYKNDKPLPLVENAQVVES